MGLENGKHDKSEEKIVEIHQDVKIIRTNLTGAVEELTGSLNDLTTALKLVTTQQDIVLKHAHTSIPVKFVIIICMIIMVAFAGGGVMKEIFELDILKHWLVK